MERERDVERGGERGGERDRVSYTKVYRWFTDCPGRIPGTLSNNDNHHHCTTSSRTHCNYAILSNAHFRPAASGQLPVVSGQYRVLVICKLYYSQFVCVFGYICS